MNEIRCSIELRADDSRLSPGRIVGTLVEYNQKALDRAELFSPGALSWDQAGIVLNRQHRRDEPVMRFSPSIDGNEVLIDAALPDTTAGRDMAVEVRNGLFRGLSIEFRALRERRVNGIRVIDKATLTGAAVVDSPSYPTRVDVRSFDVGQIIGFL